MKRDWIRPVQQSDRGVKRNAWAVSYSDMVTLLLCFFVLLYSFSTLNLEKFLEIISSLQGALGVMERGSVVQPRSVLDGGMIGEAERLEELFRRILTVVRERGLADVVRLELDQRGVVVRFVDNVLFDLGSADLRADAEAILAEVSGLLQNIPNDIQVEGHTDNLPISTPRFPSNWELSTSRATNVLRYLMEEGQIEPERLSASGYGEYRPIGSNETEEGRALNRRVDIVILRSVIPADSM